MARRLKLQYRYLALGLAACLLYSLLPDSLGNEAIYVAIAVSVPIAAYLGRRRNSGANDRVRLLLGVGLALLALSEVLFFILSTAFGFDGVSIWIESVLFVAYSVQLVALVLLAHRLSAGRGARAWFDPLAVAAAVVAVVWMWIAPSINYLDVRSTTEWVYLFGLDAIGICLIVVSARLFFGAGRISITLGFMTLGYAMVTMADLIYKLVDGYRVGSPVDSLWALGYVFIGTAMLGNRHFSPPRQLSSVEVQREASRVTALQGLLVAAIVATCAIKAAGHVSATVIVVLVITAAALLLAYGARFRGLVAKLAETSADEHQIRLAALAGTSQDAILMLDDSGTVVYLSPSFRSLFKEDRWVREGLNLEQAIVERWPHLKDMMARARETCAHEVTGWEVCVPDPSGVDRTFNISAVNHLETPGVNGVVFTVSDVSERTQMLHELHHQAFHDALTGLGTRTLLAEELATAIDSVSTSPALPVLILIDLDDFKGINDSLGHNVGDLLLKAVAARLLEAVPREAFVSRLGGDEFAVLMMIENESLAPRHAQFIVDHLTAQPLLAGTGSFALRASAGVAVYREGHNPPEMLRLADIALNEAKRDGKSRVKVFREQMHVSAAAELSFRNDLALALRNNELSLVYQPVISLKSGSVRGVEALLRWNHPTRGEVSRASFVHIAEQHGFVSEIGQWVLNTACAEAATWRGAEETYISVNISAAQITDRRLVATVREALRESGLAPERLVLELTETMFVSDNPTAFEVVAALRNLGVRLALDDFGAGHCSLIMLQEMCVDFLKIDRSFVANVSTRPQQHTLVKTLVQLAHDLNIFAVAEGAETSQEVETLRTLQCDLFQGYWFSEPLSASELVSYLGERSANTLQRRRVSL